MATHENLASLFSDIADAIRAKTGDSGAIVADNFPTAIGDIQVGGNPDLLLVLDSNKHLEQIRLTGFTAMSDLMLKDNPYLTTVDLRYSPNMETIGTSAMEGDTALAAISLPDTVKLIKTKAFYNCSSLVLTALPTSLEEIEQMGFYNCSGITISEFPQNIEIIGSSSFQGCTGITNLKIPATVERVGLYCFKDCANLTNVEIAAKSLGTGNNDCRQFSNCGGLAKVWIRESCETLSTPTASKCIFHNCPTNLQIYVEADTKPEGYGDYFNRTGTNGATEVSVVYGQKTCPWA